MSRKACKAVERGFSQLRQSCEVLRGHAADQASRANALSEACSASLDTTSRDAATLCRSLDRTSTTAAELPELVREQARRLTHQLDAGAATLVERLAATRQSIDEARDRLRDGLEGLHSMIATSGRERREERRRLIARLEELLRAEHEQYAVIRILCANAQELLERLETMREGLLERSRLELLCERSRAELDELLKALSARREGAQELWPRVAQAVAALAESGERDEWIEAVATGDVPRVTEVLEERFRACPAWSAGRSWQQGRFADAAADLERDGSGAGRELPTLRAIFREPRDEPAKSVAGEEARSEEETP